MAETGARDRLAVIVYSGDVERVHYALALASAAAAVNIPATLFFTMGGIRALLADKPDGAPGWHALAPGESGLAPGAREKSLNERGAASFGELLSACRELGVSFMVCEMGLRAVGIDASELRRDIEIAEGGIVTLLRAAEDGKIVFV
ncbi:MAG TPA: DsrE/DsrF/DrsH-like family protein [Alphaproteobacteria bacterium]|nr:DsrE/DsrF/DrsH-like family protein [Alphaproteobacteria bacterium]